MEFWQRITHWTHRHHFIVDVIVAVLVILGVESIYLLSTVTSPDPGDPMYTSRIWGAILSLPMLATLAWRRTRPRIAMWTLAVLCLASLGIEYDLAGGILAVPFIIYAAAAYGRRWDGRFALILGLLGGVLLPAKILAQNVNDFSRGEIFGVAMAAVTLWLVVLFCWTLGALTRARRIRIQALEDRARRLEIENQQERALAAADERAHIAREMHDIVAHSLSVIITQADGGRYAAVADPEMGRKVLETIAQTGRSSLAEMRRLLGVLRQEEDTEYRPQPGLEDIPHLVTDMRASGLVVALQEEGAPRSALPAGAGLTAYRLVQEALTNCLKHAGPAASVDTTLRWSGKGLHLTVKDDGRGAAADPPSAGGGNGLRGMAERVALYDGKVTAGPAPGGGFTVEALIPYSEA
ncbi:signal transduction histidine kinase [Arthrobacter woluwensis]|uniref:sensor histidine kinase n=1 Tax=Arthrobacter woluwensis TaxID=156980 RepID=UPI00277E62D7|nr:sensor histidine kinase [Arthrobacter woluwensis]MDQ0709212.1 signal transduction histidine kinase [Arthrobacter woluwensis]